MKGETTKFERVILHATEGRLKGQRLVLEDETSCILGRSKDCSHPLPDALYMVSRHHCRIKVSAPSVRIQDLGSLNGTCVNGEKIGQRGKEQSFEEALQEELAEHSLWDGDELCIGDNIFRVKFEPHPLCAEAEVRDQEKLWSGDCPTCR